MRLKFLARGSVERKARLVAGPSLTKIPPATGMPARLNTAEGGRFLFALSGWAGYWRGVGTLNDYESHSAHAVEGLSTEGIALVNVGLPSS